jgi:kynurenine formamidase
MSICVRRCIAILLMVAVASCENRSITPQASKDEPGSRESPEKAIGPSSRPLLSERRFVDLTHAFDSDTIYWPTASGFKLTVDSFGLNEKGYFYAANSFAAAEHGGTHVDAPIHFYKDHLTVDKIPLGQLIGAGVVIDVSGKCAQNRDYQITVDDFYAWEEKHARQLVDVILLLRTGFGEFWPDRKRYMGTDELGAEAVAKLHFPGLQPDAARWLTEHRSVKAVGIDAPSIDFGQSTLFKSHVQLFKHDVPVLENVANLDKLPTEGFEVIALPMKIRGGSGGPVRAVAVLK